MNLLFSLPRNLKSDVMKTARNSTIVDILGEMKLDGGHVKLLSYHLHCLDIFPALYPFSPRHPFGDHFLYATCLGGN